MKIWIYTEGSQKGPFTEAEFRALNLPLSTPVWYEGMEKWHPLAEVPEVLAILEAETSVSESCPGREGGEANGLRADAGEQHTAEAEGESRVEADAVVEVVETAVVVDEVQPEKPRSKYAPGRPAPRRQDLPDEPCPPTYLGWSVFLTVCCCSPVSLASLVASIFVSSYYNSGKLEKSRKASDIAAWLIMIAIALGFFPVMLMSLISGN